MRIMRTLSVGLAALVLSAFVHADFDGPAPLAWRWVQPTNNAPVGKPVVQDGTVYVAVGQRMFALDKESGNQKWKFPLVDPIEGNFKSSVTLVDGLAIAAADNKTIYAVDAKTGELKWSYIAPSPIYKEPVLAGKYIAFGMTDNTLFAIETATGQPAWKAPLKVFDGFLGKISAYGSDVIYFTNAYEMVSIGTTTLKANWTKRFATLGPDVQAITLGENIYVESGPYIVGLAGPNGRKIFEANSNDNLDYAPAANGDSVMGVSQDGKVYIFSASNGRPLVRKEINLGSQPSTSPSAIGKFYAVPTKNGAVNLIDSKTGDIVWSYLVRPIGDQTVQPSNSGGGSGRPGQGGPAGGGRGGQTNTQPTKVLAIPASGPAVMDGNTLLILTSDGSLLAFDKELGVDLTPPSVKMMWPSAGDLVSGQPPLELIFKIEDEASGIDTKTLKIDVDGQEMEYDFGRDGIALVRISSLGKNKPLFDGRKTITVTVSDWVGNTAKAQFQLVIDNTLKPLVRPTTGGNNQGGNGSGGGKGGSGDGR